MGDGYEEREGDGGMFETEQEVAAEQAKVDYFTVEVSANDLVTTGDPFEADKQGLIARDDARRRLPGQFPDSSLPSPEEVLGAICPVCKGTTWVIRANAELEGPIMAQLEHCDNPNCPQMKALGVRDIIHLALLYNRFDGTITVGHSDRIAALEVKDAWATP